MNNYGIDPARETALREEIVQVGKWLYERGLVVAIGGNVSARLIGDLILTTPSGLCKGTMQPDELIILCVDGSRPGIETERSRQLVPTSETFMHLEVYRQRPDVHAVVHAHPPTAVALSIAGISIAEYTLPEIIVTLGVIPTTEYATPSSEENARAIRELIVGHDAIVLQRHGALTAGSSPTNAFHKMETVEEFSKIKLMLSLLGRGGPLPAFQVEKLMEQRRKYGFSRPGDEDEFRRTYGL